LCQEAALQKVLERNLFNSEAIFASQSLGSPPLIVSINGPEK